MFSVRRRQPRAAALHPRRARRRGGRRADRPRPRPRDAATIERIDCTRFGSGAYSIPSLGRAPDVRDQGQVHPRASRPAACSSACRATSSGRRRNCILVSMAGVPTRATRRFVRRLSDAVQDPRLRLRRLRPLRDLEHLPHAQGRLGQRRAHQPFFCVPQAQLPRRHAAGHRRLQAADAPAQGRRRQARQGRAEERSVLQVAQAVGRRRSSSCSRWACAPSSRRSPSGASTT